MSEQTFDPIPYRRVQRRDEKLTSRPPERDEVAERQAHWRWMDYHQPGFSGRRILDVVFLSRLHL